MDKEVLLANYFSNRLSDEEKRLFNELLESDIDFKEQFDFEQNLQRSIRNKENHDLKAKLISFEKDVQKSTTNPSLKKTYRYFAIAASIALLIGLAWMGYLDGSSNSYEDLYAANFQEYPNTVYTITRGDSNESIERDAFVAYESQKYETSIEKFNQIPSEVRQPYIDFYLAHSYLNNGDNSAAKESFKKTIAKANTFVAESHWYLAMIALKEENKVDVEFELNKLIEGHDYNKEKAKMILNKLD